MNEIILKDLRIKDLKNEMAESIKRVTECRENFKNAKDQTTEYFHARNFCYFVEKTNKVEKAIKELLELDKKEEDKEEEKNDKHTYKK